MIRVLLMLLTGIAGSLFLFPFNLPFAPTVNTKMVLAALGAAIFFIEKTQHRSSSISKDFLILLIICLFISIWAFFCTVVNRTSDYAFATYFISVMVWLGAAYTFTWMIRQTHGQLDVQLISSYLVAICVFQCLIAYAMSFFPDLKQAINQMMGYSGEYLPRLKGRLYGIGAILDPAGLRFSGVLVILAFMMHRHDYGKQPWKGVCLILAFLIISVIGNMIARSATIGMLLAIVYLIIVPLFNENKEGHGSFRTMFIPILCIFILLSFLLYQSSPDFRTNLRFGFEGFFSLAEKGRWEVHSNDVLRSMVVWPESLKTWIIGDGYFASPNDLPNRFGQVLDGFYMKTDIGYLRYIFYFGTIGLVGMISVFFQMTATCVKCFKGGYATMFIGLLIVTLVGWLKVSSDIIMVFAPFLILAYQQDNDSYVADK